jgi:hypothetical protein
MRSARCAILQENLDYTKHEYGLIDDDAFVASLDRLIASATLLKTIVKGR